MTLTPFEILPDQWRHSVCAGNSVACRRVFKRGIIQVRNKSAETAKISVIWLADLDTYHGEKQMSFYVVPGGIIEFAEPEMHENDFLDWVVLDHVSGGELTITQSAPAELLN